MKKIVLLLFIIVNFSSFGLAQTIQIGDPFEQYLRLLVDDNNVLNLPSFNLRPVNIEDYIISSYQLSHPWQNNPLFNIDENKDPFNYSIYSPQFFSSFNSHLPNGQNDGALWQGKGLNSTISMGARATFWFLDVSVRPQLVYSQNRDFDLSQFPPRNIISEFGTPQSYTATIDRPQRFGENSISSFHPGQSWIRLNYKGLTTGVSTANIWSGPAIHNPIIFSNNAPGFFHAFVGTYKPVKTPIGNFEGMFLGGRLHESDYFDDDETNDPRFLNAIVLNYSPSFIPGLHLGAARTIQKIYPTDGLSSSDIFEVFQPFLKENFMTEETPSGNLGTHQLLSIFGRWVFPSYGAEFYTEWSRNDHSADDRDLLRHFEHARGYVIGFLKNFELSNSQWLAANFEITQLEVPRLQQFRRTGSYYNNGEVIQGFTNRGQIIGSGIGPGSNSQLISINYYEPRGMAGVSLNRVVHHNDRMYQLFRRNLLESDREARELHTVEFRLGLHSLYFMPLKNIEIQADLFWSRFLNFDYQFTNDLNNFKLQINVRYLFSKASR